MPPTNGHGLRSPSPADGIEDGDEASAAQSKASKDKECPFCRQPFTSSSLGRHLDLYIKAKNPKPPDGLHDVHKIREMRSKITRRQPRGSSGAKKQEHPSEDRSEAGVDSPQPDREAASSIAPTVVSQPSTTPAVTSPAAPVEPLHHSVTANDRDLARKTATVSEREPDHPTPPAWTSPKRIARLPLDPARPIYGGGWQSTGVISGLPDKGASMDRFASRAWDFMSAGTKLAPLRIKSSEGSALEDDETGKAAQLALREVLDSLDAARNREARVSMWDFDFMGTTFPGLCLKLLPSPKLLFSLQPAASEDSWPIEPPGPAQLTAVRAAVAKRADQVGLHMDGPDMQRTTWHVDRMYSAYEALSDHEKQQTWHLETLRAYSKTHKRFSVCTTDLKIARQQAEFFRQRFEDAAASLRRAGSLDRLNASNGPSPRPDIYTSGISGSTPLCVSADLDAALSYDRDMRSWSYERLIAKWRDKIRDNNASAGSTPAPTRAPPPPPPQQQQPAHHAYPDPRSHTASTDSPAASTLQSAASPAQGSQREVRFLWDDGQSGHAEKRQRIDGGGWTDASGRVGDGPGWSAWTDGGAKRARENEEHG